MSEHIFDRSISEELKQSYLDYAMSVIVSRALPDVRDGLKPVQRRIVYTMRELGLLPSAKFTKCANIVGNIIARYHPHGDISVYDALVRLGQNFSLRYPLVWGQGNFGSIDGDPAAAYRYTEAKLTKISEELIADIEKDTVDFAPNYDNTKKEPVVFPSKVPHLLLNGSLGIAVGMATNIPTHNLEEVIDATLFLLDNEKATIKDLLQIIKGPDFPTGGIVYGQKSLVKCYSEGRGGITVRGRAVVDESKKKDRILITEIPWQVNKSDLVRQIALLALEKTVPQIKDVRDESDRTGIRVVVELKDDAKPEVILERLFRLTDLQKNFYYNLVAIQNGIQPKLFNLKEILAEWIGHRKQVIYRRTKYDLDRAKERIHILEGLVKVLDKIDLAIGIIRKSKDKEDAKVNLKKKFVLSDRQVEVILEMPLRTLTNLEQLKIKQELDEKNKLARELEAILKSPKKIADVIKKELSEIKTKYADKRRTEIRKEEIEGGSDEEEIIDENIALLVNQRGFVRTFAQDTALSKIVKNKEEFGKVYLINTKEKIWAMSRGGRMYQVQSAQFHQSEKYLESLLTLDKDDHIFKTFIAQETDTHLFIVTKNGFGKKLNIQEALSQKRTGTQVIKLQEGDEVVDVIPYLKNNFFIATKKGMSLAFKDTLGEQGKTARGVKIMNVQIKDGDSVLSAGICEKKLLLLAFENGFWKKVDMGEFKLQQRGGRGIKIFDENEKWGVLVHAETINPDAHVWYANGGVAQLDVGKLKTQKRTNQPQPATQSVSSVIVL